MFRPAPRDRWRARGRGTAAPVPTGRRPCVATKPTGPYAPNAPSRSVGGYSQAAVRSFRAGTTAKPCGESVQTEPVALSWLRGRVTPPLPSRPQRTTGLYVIAPTRSAVVMLCRVITTFTSLLRRWVSTTSGWTLSRRARFPELPERRIRITFCDFKISHTAPARPSPACPECAVQPTRPATCADLRRAQWQPHRSAPLRCAYRS